MAAAEKLKEIPLGLILIDLIAKNRRPGFPRDLNSLYIYIYQGVFCVKFQIDSNITYKNIYRRYDRIQLMVIRDVSNFERNISTFVIYSKFSIANKKRIHITKMESKRKSLIRDWKSREQGSAGRPATKLKNRKTIGLGQ